MTFDEMVSELKSLRETAQEMGRAEQGGGELPKDTLDAYRSLIVHLSAARRAAEYLTPEGRARMAAQRSEWETYIETRGISHAEAESGIRRDRWDVEA